MDFIGVKSLVSFIFQVFKVSVEGSRQKVPVAGCFCDSGLLRHDAVFKVSRDIHSVRKGKRKEAKAKGEEEEDEENEEVTEAVIFEGPCASMFHKKDRVTSVKKNTECGLQFVSPDGDVLEVLPGDRIECYEPVRFKPELDIEFDFE